MILMPRPKGAAAAICSVRKIDLASKEISAIPDLSRSDLTELRIGAYGPGCGSPMVATSIGHLAQPRFLENIVSKIRINMWFNQVFIGLLKLFKFLNADFGSLSRE